MVLFLNKINNLKLKKRIIISLIFFVQAFLVAAQSESFELVTDRPDQTESSSVVPKNALQIESGFILEQVTPNLLKEKNYTYNTTLMRYGLFNNFELRLGFEYLGNIIKNKTIGSGFGPLYTGFKFKITEEQVLFPEMAFLGGLVLPYIAQTAYKPDFVAANMRFAFSHTLSSKFSLGYNLGIEWDGMTAVPDYFYSLAAGFAVMDKLGVFIESYGILNNLSGNEHLFDAGLTYLLLPNLQFDVSAGLGINKNSPNSFIGFGLSCRIPD